MTRERHEVRLEKKLLVNIGREGLETMGLTENVSRDGLSVSTTELLPINSEVSLQIGIADETFMLKGEVMWSRENSGSSADATNVASGIRISDAPQQYLKFVEELLSGH